MKEAHDHSRVSPEGQALGVQMARMYDVAEKRLGGEHAELGERCRTCAFRAGTVPNGCAQTQLDISKCIADGIPFYCHQRRGELCHGWVVTRLGMRDLLQPLAGTEHDYPLSPPDSQRHIVDAAEAKRERRAEKRRRLAQRQHQSDAGFADPGMLMVIIAFLLLICMLANMGTTLTDAPPALAAPVPTPGSSIAYRPYVFIDEATGCQYLSTHNSAGLAPRIAADGKTHLGCNGGLK